MAKIFALLSDHHHIRRNTFLATIALFAYEIFNYSATSAFVDLLGKPDWQIALVALFCLADLAGIAGMVSFVGSKVKQPYYLFETQAWVMVTILNTVLIWWTISVAMHNNHRFDNWALAVETKETLIRVVPVVIAGIAWVIRLCVVATVSVAIAHIKHIKEEISRKSSKV